MEITYTNNITIEDYNNLRASAGWPKICSEQAKAGLEGSTFLIVAKEGEKTVGMARVVSDGGYIAYVADVLVLPEYQRKQIGTEMMKRLTTHIKDNMKDGYQVHMILISAKGKEVFYEKFGFAKRPDDHFGCGMTQWISK